MNFKLKIIQGKGYLSALVFHLCPEMHAVARITNITTVLRKIPKITIIAKITNDANGGSKNNNSSRHTRKGGPTNITKKKTIITNIAKITSQANGSSKNNKNNKYNYCAKENTENNNYSKNNENN